MASNWVLTLLNRLTAARAAFLDAAISSRAASGEAAAALAAVAYTRQAGVEQTKATTIDLAQAGGVTYQLFAGTDQDVLIDALVIRMSGGTLVGSNLISFSIQTDDTTPQVFIASTDAPVVDLTDQAQKSWAPAGGVILLKSGKNIKLTINGGAATAAKVCDVVARYSAVTSGGYLV